MKEYTLNSFSYRLFPFVFRTTDFIEKAQDEIIIHQQQVNNEVKNNQNESEDKIEKGKPKTTEETVVVSQGNEPSLFQENLVV